MSMGKMIVIRPGSFFLLPAGKFTIRAFSYLIFLALFSYEVLFLSAWDSRTKTGIYAADLMLWAVFAAFFVGEVIEFVAEPTEYFSSGWNKFDFVIYMTWLGSVVCRVLSMEEENGFTSVRYANVMLVSVNCILLYVRLAYLCTLHPALGPLLTMMSNMMVDVKNFVMSMSFFMFGFSFAFYYLLEEYMPQLFGTWATSLYTLVLSLLGEFDFDPFYENSCAEPDPTAETACMPKRIRDSGLVLFSMYLTVALVILFNLLIAMMNYSYLRVQDRARFEFVYARSRTVFEFVVGDSSMPPPLNILVLALYLPVALVSSIGKPHDEEENWICAYCHEYQKDAGIDDEELAEWLAETEDPSRIEADDIARISRNTVVCENCHRVKNAISIRTLRSEQISYVVYLVCLWVPLVLAFGVPYIVRKTLGSFCKKKDKDKNEDESKKSSNVGHDSGKDADTMAELAADAAWVQSAAIITDPEFSKVINWIKTLKTNSKSTNDKLEDEIDALRNIMVAGMTEFAGTVLQTMGQMQQQQKELRADLAAVEKHFHKIGYLTDASAGSKKKKAVKKKKKKGTKNGSRAGDEGDTRKKKKKPRGGKQEE